MRISVVIPAFNEAGNIGRLVEETYGAVPRDMLGEVIVVDDASDDGTAAEIKALFPRHGSLRISGMASARARVRHFRPGSGPRNFQLSPPWTATGKTIPMTFPGSSPG
jgi:dolichol-phosphate mannosyltransferase